MKALLKIYIPIVIAVLVLSGCSKDEGQQFAKVHEMFANLQTYSTIAEIEVRDNKLTENYVIKQYFKYPDRYRLEVLSPDDKKGKITLYDGEKLHIYHPGIKQLYILEKFKEVEESTMFPGYFAKKLFSSEGASYSLKQEGPDQLVVIQVDMPYGNSYRKSQVLYIDAKTCTPVKMEVLDSNGEVAVLVTYKDFVYNGEIDDSLFDRKSIPAGASVIRQ